ncbi:MAG: hypothetical protein IH624_18305 [Phycisphaerae bacterium]|nr:hypothetical protein [Phycisphaerae bacterium]
MIAMRWLGVICFMLVCTGCRKDKTPEESRKEMIEKWGGYANAGQCWFLFKFQEPVNGEIAYAFQSAVGNPPPGNSYNKYVGLESLLSGLDAIQKPCTLVLNHFLASQYPRGTDELAELSQAEVDELEALLKAKKIDDVNVQYWVVGER